MEAMLEELIAKLESPPRRNARISLGFDGYLDEIIVPVRSRESIDDYTSCATITEFGNRILAAANKSTNIELVTRKWKLGGNGPILANSLARLGAGVTYVGALGIPRIHEVFRPMTRSMKVTSIENPAHTMALEFEDGKIMFGRLGLKRIDWAHLHEALDPGDLSDFFRDADLVGMVNWTQTPHLSAIWDHLLHRFLPENPPRVSGDEKPYLFVDLADPQKRSPADIRRMLGQLGDFERFYRVILGLNEKESEAVAEILEIPRKGADSDAVMHSAREIRSMLAISCCVVHPVKYAVCAVSEGVFHQDGPYAPKPLISTGAGDHFNAGFCYGRARGFSIPHCLALGAANSGYYVRTANSPTLNELGRFIDDWHNDKV